MFRKPFKVKSNTQLKASDKKKLQLEVLYQFKNLSEEEVNTILPSKEAVYAIKIITTSGKAASIYMVQKTPIFFEVEKVLFPTVCLLWHKPFLLYGFTTGEFVAQKIIDGADLMLPGVVIEDDNSPDCYGNLCKGDIVSINTIYNKAAFAIGVSALSSQTMQSSNKKGKCVEILHTYRDKLSCLNNNLKIPELGPALVFNKTIVVSIDSSKHKQFINSKDKSHFDLSSEVQMGDILASPKISNTENVQTSNKNIVAPDPEERNMDELLVNSFLKCLVTSMKNTSLPILTSVFYKNHVLEAYPLGFDLDIRKTKYKKLNEFLVEMEKSGIITLACFSKGVLSITGINFKHEILEKFQKSNLQKKYKPSSSETRSELSQEYTVSGAVFPIFSKFMYKVGDHLSGPDVRKLVATYIKNENLQVPNSNEKVSLNNDLSFILNTNQSSVTWEQLMNTITKKMGQCFSTELENLELLKKKGKWKPIEIIVSNRAGSKKVTQINNLDIYGVDIQEFCRECRYGVAASTTTNVPAKGRSIQVQIQGNQVIFVSKLLTEKYQIPKGYIRGLDIGNSRKNNGSSI